MGIDLTQLERINETSGIRSLRNKLVPLGGVLQGFGGTRVKDPQNTKDGSKANCWSGWLFPNQQVEFETHPGIGQQSCNKMSLAVQNR